ncbi:aminotransferase class I/II-fold pyridoxal phosphate-dependent enzyme [Legionella sp.]|uniref:aminotransferase class I/II-fold pyridoxal phosphate-dependent enzyme n=1 Tax=Legionella sp. TaxID=459 RepID=UPI003C810FA5
MSAQEYLHVPYGKTVHGEEEIEAVIHVLRTSTQMGKHVREMEEKIAALFAKQHGIMVNSGSSANYLALEILGLLTGSEVITPALTFSTTVAPLIKCNLIPVFIDVEPGTFNIDVSQVETMISAKTKAMMIPNLIGNLPNWKKLREIADQYNLILIEDSCDTLGATIDGVSVGQYSDISTTSFYGSHVINCAGNGGMLCVNDAQLAEKAKLLRSWGRSSSLYIESEAIENRFNIQVDGIDYDAKFVFETLGYNLEPSEMGAAFGLVQLSKLHKNIAAREYAFDRHTKFFSQYQDWFILPKQLANSHTGWLAFALTIKENAPFTRKELQIFFENRMIQTRTVFTGNILRQPGFKNIKHRKTSAGYPNADQVMRGGLLLGCHHGLTPEMIAHIHNSFEDFVKQHTFTKSSHAFETSLA